MYIPQLFDTLSEPLHAERIAHAKHDRLVHGALQDPSAVRTPFAIAVSFRLRMLAVRSGQICRVRLTQLDTECPTFCRGVHRNGSMTDLLSP
jgi:hypothetical protein